MKFKIFKRGSTKYDVRITILSLLGSLSVEQAQVAPTALKFDFLTLLETGRPYGA